MILARWSQKYEREDSYYWYGLSARDIEDINNFELTHFAYLGAYDSVFLLPLQVIRDKVRNDELNATYKDDNLRHYHIHIVIKDEKYWWNLKSGEKEDLSPYYFTIPN